MKNRNGKPLTPLLTGVSLVLLLFLSSAWLAFNQDLSRSQIKYLVNQSRCALAYKITDTSAALFKIKPQETRVELISNLDLASHIVDRAIANMPAGCSNKPLELEYAMEVVILDSDLEPISTEIYWERTRETQWFDASTGNPMRAAYYLYESTCSADSRITTINLPEDSRAERYISVRIISPTPAAASVRLYKHLDLSTERDVKGFRPMPRRLRTKLARHNIFGDDLERIELDRSMRDVLSQIPAETHDGYEYSTRQLFLYDHSLPVTGEEPPRTNISTEIDRPVFFPIQGPAKLTIKLSSKKSIETTIWRDDTLLAQTTRTPNRKRQLHFDFGPGEHLLKICNPDSSQKIVYTQLKPPTAWLSHNKAPMEDPFPVSISAYYRALPSDQGDPVVVSIPESLNNSPAMMKLMCRCPVSKTNIENQDATLYYSFKNDQGSTIDTGTIQLSMKPSDIARYYSNEAELPGISNAIRRYFQPPADAVSMEITASSPVDIAFFTSLGSNNAPIQTRGPATKTTIADTDVRFKKDLTTKQYFYFRPANWETLDQSQRKTWVSLPDGLLEPIFRPEEPDFARVASSLYPNGNVVMDRLFEPVDDDAPNDCYYVRFNNNQPVQLDIAGTSGAARLGFHYNLNQNVTSILTVTVDDRIVSRFRPVTFTGYFELPLLEKGSHTIEVSSGTDQGHVFMKLPENVFCNTALYQPRRVFRIEPGQQISVPVELVEHSVNGLNILAYKTDSSRWPIDLTVSTDTGTTVYTRPQPCITSSRIQFKGTGEKESEASYLDSGTALTQQERFFFALHKDLEPNRYDITIESNGLEPVYVRFFAMAPEDRLDA